MTEKKKKVYNIYLFSVSGKKQESAVIFHNDGEVFSKQLVSKKSIKQCFYDEYLKAADSDELDSEADIYCIHFRGNLEYSRNSWKL